MELGLQFGNARHSPRPKGNISTTLRHSQWALQTLRHALDRRNFRRSLELRTHAVEVDYNHKSQRSKDHGGTLDGQGNALWACKHARRSCPHGTDTLAIGNSKNVEIIGLSSINSKLFHISIYKTENVALRGLKIVAPEASPNTDGIHVQMSRGVTITGSSIKTGDDCISIGPGSTNMWIEGLPAGRGMESGRSLQEEGVKNITVKTAEFTGTQNGLRIKAWARDSTGFVNGVSFQHAVMKNVENPIVIDQNYCPSSHGCPSQASGIKINQVQFWDIKGTSAKKVAVTLDCSPRNPCRGISLRDIKLTYNGGPAKSFCCHASGTTMGVVDPSGCL
ncbi:unnamed protein product [Spirodela intermedia]|uniref:Uncharacterized protein n=1 Tax=Spirodela intermedia TaxID=51605 RepID=A0A7I8ITJ1_SPIIN|nr:unnamed protein product [Spirodela intermedia]CAA6660274.1 unnamed protein product [Spirodela intermedia]